MGRLIVKNELLNGVAAVAVAAAMGYAAPAVADEPPNWTGFQVGGYMGGGWGTSNIAETSGGMKINGSSSPSGVFGGGQIGYDHQIGDQFVVGVVGDLSLASIDDIYDNKLSTGKGPPAVLETSYDWLATIRARGGWIFHPTSQVYIHGGVAFAGLELRGQGSGPFGGGYVNDDAVGWTAGLGVETRVTDNISLFVEYSYLGFGESNHVIKASDKAVDFDNGLSLVKLGVSYKFNSPF
jgi:outer membrane immunogenic protein